MTNSSQPKLSVILPTYNRAQYLKLCLPTILDQTFTDFELIIIDDGSTDETSQVVEQFTDDRIVYIKQENQGEYEATNVGLKKARAEIITWVHSDDLLPQGSLAKRYIALENNPVLDFVHGDIQKIDENDEKLEVIPATNLSAQEAFETYINQYLEKEIAHDSSRFLVHHLSMMFRKSLLGNIGYFDTTLDFAGDFDWMLRALRVGRAQTIHEVLYFYRFHNQSRRETDPAGERDKSIPIISSIINRYREQ